MDKVLSSRIDESVIALIDRLAHERRLPKKRILEEAIQLYSRQAEDQQRLDVFAGTCGAWQRDESASDTVAGVRAALDQGLRRHHQG